jgi:hypothetical protein
MMGEATEHHEIVLEVESELRGLRKALKIMLRNKPRYKGNSQAAWVYSVREVRQEIEFVKKTLAEITDGDGE